MENLQIANGLSINNIPGYYSTGDIIMLNSSTTPNGFLSCDGSSVNQTLYPNLYSLLGTYYDSAGTSVLLPNLNGNANWIFPCGTVGNALGNPGISASHTHTTGNQTVNSGNYSTVSHTHNGSGNIGVDNDNHSHGGWSGGVGANNSSTTANRSNGSGQGTNLAIVGHTHSWGYDVGFNAVNSAHGHGYSFQTTCQANDHSHSATLATTSPSAEYILNNVISMRYYIKW